MAWLTSYLLALTVVNVRCWIVRRSCLQYGNFSYVRNEFALSGSLITTLLGKSPAECEDECVKEYFCKSINIENAGEKACQLNHYSAADKTDNVALVSRAGWTFKSTNYSSPWAGEFCALVNPCPVDQLCMDSCTCPGYECYKCTGKYININCLAELNIKGSALGMQDERIKDEQITTSSIGWTVTKGHDARLMLGGAWCPHGSDKDSYVQVAFPKRKIITDIAIQGHKNQDHWVKSFQLEFSADMSVWQKYMVAGSTKTFPGSTKRGNEEVIKNKLEFPIRAYAVRVLPVDWKDHPGGTICMRMELYGIDDFMPSEDLIFGPPLGVESKSIQDFQILGSNVGNQGEMGYEGRLNAPSRQWCTRHPSTRWEYIRVDFYERKIITDVAIQGHSNLQHNLYVTEYTMAYSEDGYDFRLYMENGVERRFKGVTANYKIAKSKLMSTMRAMTVFIRPTKWEGLVCMRMELYGIRDPTQPNKPAGCSNPELPLGVGSKSIPDHRMTSPSILEWYTAAKYARLNRYGIWCSKRDDRSPYLQIDIGYIGQVTGVAIQGRPTEDFWVTNFAIEGDTLGTFLATARQTFTGNKDRFSIVKHRLSPVLIARYIRIHPLSLRAPMVTYCMRTELYGCR